ncbi:MAG: M23 family metallopeptidase [Chitinispirillaceae bacterium]|nr:M23 family metallopeptidase [Chitinispirillaceae bacterium]
MVGVIQMMQDSAVILHLAGPDYHFSPLSGMTVFSSKTNSGGVFTRIGSFQDSCDKIKFVTNLGIEITVEGMNADTSSISEKWYTSYNDTRRSSFKMIQNRLISKFGDYRASEKKGHKHAGVDLKGSSGEMVFPISNGVVISTSNDRFSSYVVVCHRLKNGETLFSKYVHLKVIKVNAGDYIDHNSPIGRIFNQNDLKQSGYSHPHVHLEIRTSYDDKGAASSYSMTMEALKKYCIDPLLFFRDNLSSDE